MPDPAPPFDIENPAAFYLGREYDLAARAVREDRPPVMYEARDLLTHGVVVGMTGSGKTGLCVSLLEEAAIDSIPAIIIDPKGDLTNLLLQFPGLDPEQFREWVNPDDARRAHQSLPKYAADLAERWKKGLADTLQPVERVARLQASAEWAIYTPGSDAGLSLGLLRSFAAPPAGTPRELLNQKIDATATALLGLTGVSADPVQSREHILIAQLLLHAWSKREDLDLARLITRIQVPPLRTIGAFDVDTFYPEKDRLKLALALNNLLASPSFSTWIEGEPLDLTHLLHTASGKPRHLIFYLAHLDDAQRMFFLTLLLEEVLGWVRKQPGTSSLRAILFFDELYGYLPPYPANPPTKVPLMTLLKQARAYGLGVLLATQNPVDLDYKALSNAGTWIVGKLQTERDKARLIEGLEGVAAERGSLTDRKHLDSVISSLGNRVFLLHDVHRPHPVLFQSRWALSFLRGPLTRDQVAKLMEPVKQQREPAPSPEEAAEAREADAAFKRQLGRPTEEPVVRGLTDVPPGLPSGMPQFYLPPNDSGPVVYRAMLYAAAETTFLDRKRKREHKRVRRLLAATPNGEAVAWADAQTVTTTLLAEPLRGAKWGEVPEVMNTLKKLKALQKKFAEFLYVNERLRLYENRELDLVSQPGEDVTAFQGRCREAALSRAAEESATERAKMSAASEPASTPPPRPRGAWWDRLVLGWFKPEPPVVLGPTKEELARQKTRAASEKKIAAILAKWGQIGEEYEEVLLTPRRTDVTVTAFGLAWVPETTAQ